MVLETIEFVFGTEGVDGAAMVTECICGMIVAGTWSRSCERREI